MLMPTDRNPDRTAPRAFVQLPRELGDLVDKLADENEISRTAMTVILIRRGLGLEAAGIEKNDPVAK